MRPKDNKLPYTALLIIKHLRDNGQKTVTELIIEMGLSTRSARYTVRKLLDRKMLRKIPSLVDLRSHFYVVNEEMGDLIAEIEVRDK